MQTLKDQVAELVQKLPSDCTLEDIQYELYVLEKIRKAELAVADHGTASHEEAKQRMSAWLSS